MHDAKDHARECVLKLLGTVAGIDADKSLSPHGRDEQKKSVGEKALAKLESSEHLAKAQRAVSDQIVRWEKEIGLVTPKPDAPTAMLHAEVRAHLASMKSAPGRLNFINSNLGLGDPDFLADSILSAPAWLSGLSPEDLNIVRTHVVLTRNPEIAAARAETEKALSETEKGYRAAVNMIREVPVDWRRHSTERTELRSAPARSPASDGDERGPAGAPQMPRCHT